MDAKRLQRWAKENLLDQLPSDIRGLVVGGVLGSFVQAAGPIVVDSGFFYYGAWIFGGILATRLFRPPTAVRTRGTIESTAIFVREDRTSRVVVWAILRNLRAPSCFTDWNLFVRLKDTTEWQKLQVQYIDQPFTAGTAEGKSYTFHPQTLLQVQGLNSVPQGGALTGIIFAEAKNHMPEALADGVFRLTCVDVTGREHVLDQAPSLTFSKDAFPPFPTAVRGQSQMAPSAPDAGAPSAEAKSEGARR